MLGSTSIRVATDMEEQQILGWDTPSIQYALSLILHKTKKQLRAFLVHYNTEDNVKILSLTMFYSVIMHSH